MIVEYSRYLHLNVSLSACRNLESLVIQEAHREDSDSAQADLNLHWVHMSEDTCSDVTAHLVHLIQ